MPSHLHMIRSSPTYWSKGCEEERSRKSKSEDCCLSDIDDNSGSENSNSRNEHRNSNVSRGGGPSLSDGGTSRRLQMSSTMNRLSFHHKGELEVNGKVGVSSSNIVVSPIDLHHRGRHDDVSSGSSSSCSQGQHHHMGGESSSSGSGSSSDASESEKEKPPSASFRIPQLSSPSSSVAVSPQSEKRQTTQMRNMSSTSEVDVSRGARKSGEFWRTDSVHGKCRSDLELQMRANQVLTHQVSRIRRVLQDLIEENEAIRNEKLFYQDKYEKLAARILERKLQETRDLMTTSSHRSQYHLRSSPPLDSSSTTVEQQPQQLNTPPVIAAAPPDFSTLEYLVTPRTPRRRLDSGFTSHHHLMSSSKHKLNIGSSWTAGHPPVCLTDRTGGSPPPPIINSSRMSLKDHKKVDLANNNNRSVTVKCSHPNTNNDLSLVVPSTNSNRFTIQNSQSSTLHPFPKRKRTPRGVSTGGFLPPPTTGHRLPQDVYYPPGGAGRGAGGSSSTSTATPALSSTRTDNIIPTDNIQHVSSATYRATGGCLPGPPGMMFLHRQSPSSHLFTSAAAGPQPQDKPPRHIGVHHNNTILQHRSSTANNYPSYQSNSSHSNTNRVPKVPSPATSLPSLIADNSNAYSSSSHIDYNTGTSTPNTPTTENKVLTTTTGSTSGNANLGLRSPLIPSLKFHNIIGSSKNSQSYQPATTSARTHVHDSVVASPTSSISLTQPPQYEVAKAAKWFNQAVASQRPSSSCHFAPVEDTPDVFENQHTPKEPFTSSPNAGVPGVIGRSPLYSMVVSKQANSVSRPNGVIVAMRNSSRKNYVNV